MANRFIVSVAVAIGRNASTKQGVFYGRANLSSAFTLAMQEAVVRGGINNAVLYTYKHSRDLTVNIEQAIFGKQFLALNSGSSIVTGASTTLLATECVTFNGSGVVTLAQTPTTAIASNVTIFLEDGRVAFPDSISGKTITYADGASKKLYVTYEYVGTADTLSIEATKPPSILDLTLIAEVRDTKAGLVEYLQINIPSFQVDGNYELSFTADGVSTEKLTGKALSVEGATCADGDTYAYIKWIPVASASATTAATEIVTTPTSITLATAGTAQLVTKLMYSGTTAPTRLVSGLTYTVNPTGKFTVSASGLVTAATVTGSDTATVEVTYTDGSTTFKDYVFLKGTV